MTRLPAGGCVICEKTLDEVGGQRITAQRYRGLRLTDRPAEGRGPGIFCTSRWVEPGLHLGVWGEIWDERSIERATDQVRNGLHPWYCQRCARHVCPKCGSLHAIPMGSDLIHENGCASHQMIIPVGNTNCSNSECENFGAMGRDYMEHVARLKATRATHKGVG